jgi:uncharacterized protein YkwD
VRADFLETTAGAIPNMRFKALFTVMLAMMILLNAASSPGQKKTGPVSDPASLELLIHKLVNSERAKNGLPQLGWNETLRQVARDHSRDMAERGFFSHVGPDGADFRVRYQRQGFRCERARANTIYGGAENISSDNLFSSVLFRNGIPEYLWSTPEDIAKSVVARWMRSPGHKRNILAPQWKTEGIGIAVSDDGRVLVTQNFC